MRGKGVSASCILMSLALQVARYAAVLAAVFLLPQFVVSASYAASTEKPVTVLLYHRFNEPDYPSTNISRKALIQQMDFLKDENYHAIDISTFRGILDGKIKAKGNEVLVTIDDGYKSAYETAWPIFKRYGVPFVVFLSTRAIEEGYRSIMTWQMIDEMRKDGVAFANHTHRHPHLGFKKAGETESKYRRRIREEVTTAARILEKHKIKNRLFAYPYGEYNAIMVEELKAMGYDLMFSQNPGVAWYGADKTRVDRMAVVGEDISRTKFGEKLSRLPLRATIKEPAGSFFYDEKLAKISIRIAEPLKYFPGQVNLFLSEKGRLDHFYDRKTGELYVDGPMVLTRPLNRIILTAREMETGRFGMMSWLLLRTYLK